MTNWNNCCERYENIVKSRLILTRLSTEAAKLRDLGDLGLCRAKSFEYWVSRTNKRLHTALLPREDRAGGGSQRGSEKRH